MKITVLSDGAWGTALATVLLDNGHEVTLWGAFPDYLETMRNNRENIRFLPGVRLPEALRIEDDIRVAAGAADLVVLATPTQFLRGVLEKFAPVFDSRRQILVNVAKGIEVGSWLRVSQITRAMLGESRYVALSGPSHAEEVARRVPTLVVAASADAEAAATVQKCFMNEVFRVYTASDVVGVELGGALKNVIAVAAGIADGMELGDNPKAALLTRGISEMGRLGEALGGSARTFSGLSGIGDLIVTCSSRHSRNRHVGEELGRGRRLSGILEAMGMVVAEGVTTARGAKHLAEQVGVETPIINEVHRILFKDKEPRRAIVDLMTRDPRAE